MTTAKDSTLSTLQQERDELSRRLNDALARLASSDAGTFSMASPDSGPQHDQNVLAFRRLKLQDFQALSLAVYSIWQKKSGSDAVKPGHALALCREKLSHEVLVEGSKLLAIRRSASADADLQEVSRAIYESIRTRFKMRNQPPAELGEKIKTTITRSLELLRAMSLARPAAFLLVPAHRTPFTPELHEAVVGCPERAPAAVQFTVFPGYLVASSNRVLEKALVYSE